MIIRQAIRVSREKVDAALLSLERRGFTVDRSRRAIETMHRDLINCETAHR
jgi:hypothetical protein